MAPRDDQGFTGVADSPVEGRRGGEADMVSPEPGRQGPTSPQATWGAGLSKSAAAHGRRGRGGGAGSGGGEAAAPSLDCYKHNRNSDDEKGPPSGEFLGLDPVRQARCGKYTLYRLTHDGEQFVYDWMRVLCKSWHCPYCGPREATRLRKAIAEKARELKLNRFLTLTLDPARVPADVDPVLYIRGEVWAKFRTYLKRRYRRTIQYIAVLEFTKAGVPHLHLLIDEYIPQAWIAECWDALGAGRVVYIKRVYEMNRVARYLAKYLTKQALLSVPRGVRRWTVSRGIKLFQKPESSGDWCFLFQIFDALYRVAAMQFLLAEERDRDGEVRFFSTYQSVAASWW